MEEIRSVIVFNCFSRASTWSYAAGSLRAMPAVPSPRFRPSMVFWTSPSMDFSCSVVEFNGPCADRRSSARPRYSASVRSISLSPGKTASRIWSMAFWASSNSSVSFSIGISCGFSRRSTSTGAPVPTRMSMNESPATPRVFLTRAWVSWRIKRAYAASSFSTPTIDPASSTTMRSTAPARAPRMTTLAPCSTPKVPSEGKRTCTRTEGWNHF